MRKTKLFHDLHNIEFLHLLETCEEILSSSKKPLAPAEKADSDTVTDISVKLVRVDLHLWSQTYTVTLCPTAAQRQVLEGRTLPLPRALPCRGGAVANYSTWCDGAE